MSNTIHEFTGKLEEAMESVMCDVIKIRLKCSEATSEKYNKIKAPPKIW